MKSILDRVEDCVCEMVIPKIDDMALQNVGYDLLSMGIPNEGYKTPLRGLYRDLRDVEALDKYCRVPAVFLLLDTGFVRGNQDQAPFSQDNYPINAMVTHYPILLRTLLKQGTGQLVVDCEDELAPDRYRELTADEWCQLRAAAGGADSDKSYKASDLSVTSLQGILKKTPITDQISNLLNDFDQILNPINLAGKQPEYPDNVGVVDAYVTSVECLQGVLSPFEIVDYTLEITFWQPKDNAAVFNSTDPIISTVYERG